MGMSSASKNFTKGVVTNFKPMFLAAGAPVLSVVKTISFSPLKRFNRNGRVSSLELFSISITWMPRVLNSETVSSKRLAKSMILWQGMTTDNSDSMCGECFGLSSLVPDVGYEVNIDLHQRVLGCDDFHPHALIGKGDCFV